MAGAGDGPALRRLAGLDSSPPPHGRVLLGEVDGELRAAYSLDDGSAIADPFRPTAPLVEMLRATAQPSGWRSTGLRVAPTSSRRLTGVV